MAMGEPSLLTTGYMSKTAKGVFADVRLLLGRAGDRKRQVRLETSVVLDRGELDQIH